MEYLDRYQRIRFPDPERANPWGVVAQGGNLSPGVVLSAYEQGIFPWYEEEPILWFSPDPRFVLYLDEFHIPRRVRRTVNNRPWTVSFDGAFDRVIEACRAPRRGESGTWITDAMSLGYRELHRLGHTHSVEVWDADQLIGGLYGLAVGAAFAGESMFSRERDASKVALIALVGLMDLWRVPCVDCQSYTPHLAMFGARDVDRRAFLSQLSTAVPRQPAIPPDWRPQDGTEMLQRGLNRGARNDQ